MALCNGGEGRRIHPQFSEGEFAILQTAEPGRRTHDPHQTMSARRVPASRGSLSFRQMTERQIGVLATQGVASKQDLFQTTPGSSAAQLSVSQAIPTERGLGTLALCHHSAHEKTADAVTGQSVAQAAVGDKMMFDCPVTLASVGQVTSPSTIILGRPQKATIGWRRITGRRLTASVPICDVRVTPGG